jgi:hypothetical protein
MINYGTIVLILMSLNLSAQKKYNRNLVSKETNKVVEKIQKINQLMGSAVYYEGSRPLQYDHFEKLREIASKDELLQLINHPNGVVKCYAFWALSLDTSVDLFPILIDHMDDYQIVNTQFGCIGSEVMVGDFFIQNAASRHVDLESQKNDSISFLKLDSILIYSNSKLYAKSYAISRAKPNKLLYPRIREIVVKENDPNALVPLAKYNQQEDIPLILKSKSADNDDGYYYIYKAIQEFPHSDFMPLLEKNLNKTLDDTHFSTEWRELYTAIAIYKNEKSIELLEIPFTKVKHENIRKYHIDFVYSAIQLNKCKMYDALLWKMWSEENRISPDVYHYLKERDSVRVYDLAKKSMLGSNEIYSSNMPLNFDDLGAMENITVLMLDEILRKDTKLGIDIIYEKLKNEDVHDFIIFTDHVVRIKDPVFVEPLFKRLEQEWNAHVYLNIVQTLIAYQDATINKRILDTRKINRNLNEGWGSESLDKLLRDNSIMR